MSHKKTKDKTQSEDNDDKYEVEKLLNKSVPFFEIFDLDRQDAFLVLCLWRLFFTLAFTRMLVNPDELYQGT